MNYQGVLHRLSTNNDFDYKLIKSGKLSVDKSCVWAQSW